MEEKVFSQKARNNVNIRFGSCNNARKKEKNLTKSNIHSLKLVEITLIKNNTNFKVVETKHDKIVNKLNIQVYNKKQDDAYKCDKIKVSRILMPPYHNIEDVKVIA